MYFSKLFIHPCNFPQFSGSSNMCRHTEMKWKYNNKHWLTVTHLQMSNLKWYHMQWCTQCHTHSKLDIWRMQVRAKNVSFIFRVVMPAIMMADPGRQGPGPGESKGVYGHFGSPADEHQREAEHLRRMQVTYTLLCFFGWWTMKMTKTNGPKDWVG